MKRIGFAMALTLTAGLGAAIAQLDLFPSPVKNPALWHGDTLYIGASFVRAGVQPVSVWLIGNEAGWSGDLLYIDPKTGMEERLFGNHDAPGTKVNLSATHEIAFGDTVHFAYRVTTPENGKFPSAITRLPKYTGPNIPGTSKYVTVPANPKFGHRWSVAGRDNDSIVRFGFEDNADSTSDFDFDDIIFGTNLSMAHTVIPSRLVFTDKQGTPLAQGAVLSPGGDSLYLAYTDDDMAAKKEFSITVKNRKLAAAPDSEVFLSRLPVRNPFGGRWFLSVPLQEAPGKPGDKLVQGWFLGEVTAQARSHDATGAADGGVVSATIRLARPDKPESIRIAECADSLADIVRSTTCIRLSAEDQDFTPGVDTVWARVDCDSSKRGIDKVPLVEQPGGGYRSGDIAKSEMPNGSPSDKSISCNASDNLTATYIDEVYGGKATVKRSWSASGALGLAFALPGSPQVPITQLLDNASPDFLLVVRAPSPNPGIKDTILVTLTTSQGEKEVFAAGETEANSGVFMVQVGFAFQSSPIVPNDGSIEVSRDAAVSASGQVIQGETTVGGRRLTANLVLKPAMNLVRKAYLKDSDGDGRADKLYLEFARSLDAPPASVSPVYWNGVGAVYANAMPPALSLLAGHPEVVVADFSAAPFPKGLTSIAPGEQPFASLPGDPIFASQKPMIEDSVGPILISGVIKAFAADSLPDVPAEYRLDTVIAVVSEPLRAVSDFKAMLMLSKPVNGTCLDYAHAVPVVPAANPYQIYGSNQYLFLVSAGAAGGPRTGDCLYLNANGYFADLMGNLPVTHGELLQGKSPPGAIRAEGYGRRGGLAGLFRINAGPGVPASLEVRHRGAFRVLLRSVDGSVKVRVQGMGPGSFPLMSGKPGAGIFLMEIRAGAESASRLETF